jgi:hypothetical protein
MYKRVYQIDTVTLLNSSANSHLEPNLKMLKVKDDTHKELTVIMGTLTARNGETKTYDDVLKELIANYREKRKRNE